MSTEAALEVAGVGKAFGSLVVARGLDLRITPGERRGLIGVNGAGKTTLFNMISGELLPDAGEVFLFGERITRLPVAARALKGLGRTYQVSTLVPPLSVRANLLLAGGNGRLPPAWRGWRQQRLDPATEEVIDELRIRELLDEPVSELSHGVLRQVELALVLAKRPRVLLLDEPAAGLSRAERALLVDLLRGLPRSVTVVMVEHDIDMVLGLSDEISVLHQGELFASAPPQEIAADPRVRDIYLGRHDDGAGAAG